MRVRHDSAAGGEMAVRRGAAPAVNRIAFECEARIIARLTASSTRYAREMLAGHGSLSTVAPRCLAQDFPGEEPIS